MKDDKEQQEQKSSRQIVEETASSTQIILNSLIQGILMVDPTVPFSQKDMDKLRGVHRAVAYHMGAITRVLEKALETRGLSQSIPLVHKERDDFMKSGADQVDAIDISILAEQSGTPPS